MGSTPNPQPSGAGTSIFGQMLFGGANSTGNSGFPTLPVLGQTTTPYYGVSQRQLDTIVPGLTQDQALTPSQYGQIPDSLQGQATVSEWLNWMENLDPQTLGSLQDELILGGFLNPASRTYMPLSPQGETTKAFTDALLRASGSKQSWMQLVSDNVQSGVGARAFNLSTTSDVTQITDPSKARDVLVNTMRDMLGRAPTPSEMRTFASSLASSQQQNPEHTYISYDVGDALNKNSGGVMQGSLGYGIRSFPKTEVQSGGVDPNAEAQSQVYSQNGGELAQVRGDQAYQLFLNMLKGEGSA
jgi:hypothetical protein